MRLGVDVHVAAKVNRRGVPHYAAEITRRLIARSGSIEWKLLHVGLDADRLPPAIRDDPRLSVITQRRLGANLRSRGTRTSHEEVLQGVDAMFLPALGPTVIARTTPTVLTVHDMLHVTHRDQFAWRHQAWTALARPAKQITNATLILADSDDTRMSLTTLAGVEPEKIRVVPLGIDDEYFEVCSEFEKKDVMARYGLAQGYVLHVGAIERRKNLVPLIAAVRAMRRTRPGLTLVLAGGMAEHGEAVLAAAGPLDHVRMLGFVDAADKRGLYAAAGVYCSLSHSEGFGLTPLEALAVGTPVVASDIPAFRETMGRGAALLLEDRHNPTAVQQALERVLDDEVYRARLRENARVSLSRYRWDACTDATLAALSQAATGRGL